jgi:putative hydrolase of the HAD superfamily
MQKAAEVHLDTHRRWLRPRPDSLDTLKQLRSSGHKLGIVSGCPSDVPHLWHETPFLGLFDAELFSCSVGLLKPDPRLYALACARLAVEAADCLYVGDSGEEIVGAREAGMTAVHLCARGEKEAAMREPEAREWTGARAASPSEVLGLLH